MLAEISFLVISLFMIHEFEEIIFIKYWIKNNEKNPKLKNEMFILNKKYYISTEVISIAIAEEFIFAFVLLFAGIRFNSLELILGLTFVHVLHLFWHIFQAIKYHRFPPGSITAILTVPLFFLIFYQSFQTQNINIFSLFLWTLFLLLLILSNLIFLLKNTKKIEKLFFKN